MSDFLVNLDGFSDSSVRGGEVEKYRGKRGVTDRLGFIYTRTPLTSFSKEKLTEMAPRVESGDMEKATLDGKHYIHQISPVAARVHYNEKFKNLGVFFCLSKPGHTEVCCENAGKPTLKIGMLVVHYQTDKSGALNKPFNYVVKPWIFSEAKYNSLKMKNKEFPLISHDLMVTCTEEDYQKLDFSPCKDAAWRANSDVENQILDEAASMMQTLQRELGRERNLDELREAFGLSSGAVPADTPSADDLSELLAQFGN